MRPTLRLAGMAVVSLAAVNGCRDITAPVAVGSRFALVKVGDATLPTVTSHLPSGWTELGDTIVFLGESSAGSGTVEHHETGYLPGHAMSPTTTVYERLYNWDGHVLRFRFPPCPPNALCAQAIQETGILADGYLTITYGNSPLFPRTYRRIS